MAFNFGVWLEKVMAQRNPAGGPLYSPTTVQDLVALVLLSSKQPLDKLPENISTIFGAFLMRSGMNKVKDPAALKQAMGAYFKAHPLPPSLVHNFQAEFRRDARAPKKPPRPAKISG
ncbi:MAG: hypothetical protein IPJ65_29405 [Archangiaceae bacterium]|nr:hypothetical protein [Archangiaceae bacterium]